MMKVSGRGGWRKGYKDKGAGEGGVEQPAQHSALSWLEQNDLQYDNRYSVAKVDYRGTAAPKNNRTQYRNTI